jgi:hypothetical protein
MGTTFLDLLSSQLSTFFAPLLDGFTDASQLTYLLDELGYTSDDDTGSAKLVAALQPIAGLVQEIEAALGKPSPSFGDIASLLSTGKQGFLALQSLDNSSDLAAEFGFMGKDLLDLLTGIYIAGQAPLTYRLLVLLTVIDFPAEIVPTNPVVVNNTTVRGPVQLPRLHPDRLIALLQNPVATLKQYYLNALQTDADAAAMADKLFPRFASILTYLGVANKYGLLPEEAAVMGDAAAYMQNAFTVYLTDLFSGSSAEAGFNFAISPASRGNLGLVIGPFGSVQYTNKVGDFSVELDFTAAIDAVAIGPLGTHIAASAATTTVEGKFLATLATPDGSTGTTSTSPATPASTGTSTLPTPAFILGSPTGTRLQVGGAQFELDLSFAGDIFGAGVSAAVSQAALVITPGDGDSFLTSVLPANGLNFQFDLGVSWSSAGGLAFHGAAGLDAALPIGINIADVFRIPTLYLAIRGANGQLATEASIQVSLNIGPIAATIDHLGMAAAITFPASGGNLGSADLNFHFQPPTGVGLSIDTAGVSGGGFLAHANNQYSGALQLKFNDLALQAFGLITTQVAGADGYSLIALIDSDFPPVQLGWGFTLDGVGGLLAIHRTASVDALRAAVKSGKVATILFPTSPISNAPQVLSALDTLFPTAPGRFLFGPMALIGWGTPTILTASVAVILELPEPIEIILLAKLEAKLPTPSSALVHINMDALGVLDLTQSELSLDASLFDSKLISFTITGDMALRSDWSSKREFLLAIGGFHPQFSPPAGFPSLNRVAINMPSGIVSKLRLAAYLAITSNSVQFGATLDIYIGVSGCGISGHLGFDALLQLDPFQFSADISGSVAVAVGGDDLASVSLDATLTGPAPWHIAGSFKIHIIFFDIGVSFSASWGLNAPSQPVSTVDVDALLNAALADPRNWNSQLPSGVAALTSTRQVSDPNTIFAHPLAMLEVHEQVVPLGLTITHFGEAVPSGASEFAITGFNVGGNATAYTAVQDDFAPAQFFDLSDNDKLSRPSTERHDAGAVMSGNLVTNGPPRAKTIDYETCYINSPGVVTVDEGAVQPFPWSGLQFVMSTGSAARKIISRSGSRRYAAPGNPIKVQEPGFIVAAKADLAATSAPGSTYSDAAAVLKSVAPAERAGLQIVGTHELAEVAG